MNDAPGLRVLRILGYGLMRLALGMTLIGHLAWAQTSDASADATRCWPADSSSEGLGSSASPAIDSPSKPTSSKLSDVQKTCWITLSQADLQVGPQAPYWIDIRSVRQANALSLAGPLRITPSEITLKPFLRRTPIILVGTGLDEVAVEKICSDLLTAGMSSVRALRGGARTWRAAGRPVALSEHSVDSDEMDLLDFITGATRERWPVIALDLPSTAGLPIPASRLARVNSKKIGSVARLFPAQVRQKVPVVVLAPDALSSQRLRAAQTARRTGVDTVDLVWVRGGYAAYREMLKQQRLIAANRGRFPKEPGPCGAIESRESPL